MKRKKNWKKKKSSRNKRTIKGINLVVSFIWGRVNGESWNIWNYVSRDWHMNKHLRKNDEIQIYTFGSSSLRYHVIRLSSPSLDSQVSFVSFGIRVHHHPYSNLPSSKSSFSHSIFLRGFYAWVFCLQLSWIWTSKKFKFVREADTNIFHWFSVEKLFKVLLDFSLPFFRS